MKKIALLVLTLFLMVVAVMPVSATSMYGMKGLISMPVADTQTPGKLGINFQVTKTNNYLGFSYGLLENLELYANMSNDNAFSDTDWAGGLKLRIFQETKIRPSFSLGLMNKDLYVVGSKTMDLRSTLRLHIGYGNGQFQGLFLGVNKMFNVATIRNSGDKVALPVMNANVEFFRNKINLGMDVHLNDYFILNVGLLDFRNPTAGFSYTNQF